MNELKSGEGQIRAVIHITRKATGKVETHELVFTPLEAEERSDGSDAQRDGAQHASDSGQRRD